MKESTNLDLSFMRDDELNLQIIKRRVPMKHDFLKGEEARKHINTLNQLIYFYKYFETRFEIHRGDVFLARFEFECGHELTGNHYVVAILDSSKNNPLVTVVPIKSAKGREVNPASDILLGDIEGFKNSNGSIAVINQVRTIDKSRLLDAVVLAHLNEFYKVEMLGEYTEINCQSKKHYRLTNEQFSKIHKAAQQYIFNGFIKSE